MAEDKIEISESLSNKLKAAGLNTFSDIMRRKNLYIEGLNEEEAKELAVVIGNMGMGHITITIDRATAEVGRLKCAIAMVGEAFVILGETLLKSADEFQESNANEGGETDGKEMVEGDGAGDGGIVHGDFRPGPEPGDPAADK
jgi:hypothetical protein